MQVLILYEDLITNTNIQTINRYPATGILSQSLNIIVNESIMCARLNQNAAFKSHDYHNKAQ